MMEQLSGWFKEIILIILFATFVDLLLPHRSMQRYVKVVVSLIVLLTILTPIIRFLRSDYTLDLQMSALSGKPAAEVPADGQWESLAAIEREAERLKQSDARDTEKIVKSKLEQMIKQQVEQAFPVTVRSAEASIAYGKDGTPGLSGVRIVIGNRAGPPAAASPQGSPRQGEIAAVKPVVIDPIRPPEIRIGGEAAPAKKGASSGAGSGGQDAEAAGGGERGRLLRDIALSVARTWEVGYTDVTVVDGDAKAAS